MKLALIPLLLGMCITSGVAAAQTVHYLNCNNGNDASNSLRPETAWRTLAQANQYVFHAGDSLLLKRGTTCRGGFRPKGSGTMEHAITLGAYGVGALPAIVAAGQEAGIKLDNQQYWNIEHVDVSGSSPCGIFITGSSQSLTHFRISDLVVHDVPGKPTTKQSGLIVIGAAANSRTIFNDIVIDGATAYNTSEWAGIVVNAGIYSKDADILRGSNVTIRNSIVHDVAGDGILLTLAKHGMIEHNVAWNTGMEYSESIGTPDGIWEWNCEECTVQYNEGFFTDSPGVDGGVFDIDWGNIDNTVQYNFAHDSQGYCVSIFGAEGDRGSSRNSVIRGNLCLDNARSPREAQRQGAIYLSTWDGGHLSGVQIYNNTVVWDPPVDTAAVVNEAELDPNAEKAFANNLIVSRAAILVRSVGNIEFRNNQYWVKGDLSPAWSFDGKTYKGLSALNESSGQETGSSLADPIFGKLFEPSISTRECKTGLLLKQDLYGRQMPATCIAGAIAPGALERKALRPAPAFPFLVNGKSYRARGWTLLAILSPETEAAPGTARSDMVVLQSMLQQFVPLGLHVDVAPVHPLTADSAANWASDWSFGKVRLLENPKGASLQRSGINPTPRMLLINPERRIVAEWSGSIEAPAVELRLRDLLGTPVGMQTLVAR